MWPARARKLELGFAFRCTANASSTHFGQEYGLVRVCTSLGSVFVAFRPRNAEIVRLTPPILAWDPACLVARRCFR